MIATYSQATQEGPPPVANLSQVWTCYARAGHGSTAENDLVERHVSLVKTVVGRLAMALPPHVDIEDLQSAGLVGLLHAIRRFNPLGGASFETYARVRIRGAVLDELRRMDWVPRSVHEKARRVQEVMQRLEQECGSVPGEGEVARAMGLGLEEYRELLAEIRPATFVSLDAVKTGADEDRPRPMETLSDDREPSPGEQAARRELAQLLADRIEQLPDAQRKVLALYYYEDLRLREIAEVFGVTESRICQIHAQAILALKSYLRRTESGGVKPRRTTP
ncbi:MAG: FliA/WhiG family RNA polymerase sigma factor [Verrucomicrobiae bacterium]|nr:FliA/WhiG family RNA polymerase sigma factor [Verrucomicrobiae bacterium]